MQEPRSRFFILHLSFTFYPFFRFALASRFTFCLHRSLNLSLLLSFLGSFQHPFELSHSPALSALAISHSFILHFISDSIFPLLRLCSLFLPSSHLHLAQIFFSRFLPSLLILFSPRAHAFFFCLAPEPHVRLRLCFSFLAQLARFRSLSEPQTPTNLTPFLLTLSHCFSRALTFRLRFPSCSPAQVTFRLQSHALPELLASVSQNAQNALSSRVISQNAQNLCAHALPSLHQAPSLRLSNALILIPPKTHSSSPFVPFRFCTLTFF